MKWELMAVSSTVPFKTTWSAARVPSNRRAARKLLSSREISSTRCCHLWCGWVWSRWHAVALPLIDSIIPNQAALWRAGNASLRGVLVSRPDDGESVQCSAYLWPNHPPIPIDMASVSYLIRKLLRRFDYKKNNHGCNVREKVMISWLEMCK